MENLEFAMFIDEAICTTNLYEKDLCDMFDVPEHEVRQWRNGENIPTPTTLALVAFELLAIRQEESTVSERARRFGEMVLTFEHELVSM